jgi:type 2 lantibiotic biosynthesis protein LanM
MEARLQPILLVNTLNRPSLGDHDLRPEAFVGEILKGFGGFYRFLVEHGEELLGRRDLLPPFRRTPVRHLLRQSQTYGLLLNKLRFPRFQREGVDASLAMEVLSRAFLKGKRRPRVWPALRAEHRALSIGDIPLFSSRANSTTLATPRGNVVPRYFFLSGYPMALSHVKALSERDLALQSRLIEDAFLAKGTRFGAVHPGTDHRERKEVPYPGTLEEELDRQALAIGETIVEQALILNDGSLAWYAITQDPDTLLNRVSALKPGLYDGQAGLGFFLSALERAQPNRGFKEAALGSVAGMRDWLRQRPGVMRSDLGLGAMNGLGSLAYACMRMGTSLQDESLISDAEAMVRLITRARIEADDELDVMSGSAGTTLVLLQLYQLTGREEHLEKAWRCGQHLLSRQAASPAGPKAWPNKKGSFLTGFSHGAAGTSHALLRLWECCGDRLFRTAALVVLVL